MTCFSLASPATPTGHFSTKGAKNTWRSPQASHGARAPTLETAPGWSWVSLGDQVTWESCIPRPAGPAGTIMMSKNGSVGVRGLRPQTQHGQIGQGITPYLYAEGLNALTCNSQPKVSNRASVCLSVSVSPCCFVSLFLPLSHFPPPSLCIRSSYNCQAIGRSRKWRPYLLLRVNLEHSRLRTVETEQLLEYFGLSLLTLQTSILKWL